MPPPSKPKRPRPPIFGAAPDSETDSTPNADVTLKNQHTNPMAPLPKDARPMAPVDTLSGVGPEPTRADAVPEPPPTADAWDSYDEATAWLDGSHSDVESAPAQASGQPTLDTLSAPEPAALAPKGSPSQPPQPEASQNVMSGAHLVLLGSGTKGSQRIPLNRPPVRLGRAAGNEVSIDDPSVSREHARLEMVGDDWQLLDNQSGNGTFVNGKRISQQTLQDGDEIVLGKVPLQFVRPFGTPLTQAVAQPVPKRSWLTWALTGVVVLGCAALGLQSLQAQRRHRMQARQAEEMALLEQGVRAFTTHDWVHAQQMFERLGDMAPGHPDAKRYLLALPQEKAAGRALEQARSEQAQGHVSSAFKAAQLALDSTYHAEARTLLEALQEELDVRVTQAATAYSAKKYPEAQELLKEVEAAQPGRADVAVLQLRVSLATGIHTSGPIRLNALDDKRAGGASMPAPLATAVRLFARGDVDGAVALLQPLATTGPTELRERARDLRDKMAEFAEAWRGGEQQHHEKKIVGAIRSLSQAKALEAKISRGQSVLLQSLDKHLADMYYLSGMGALQKEALPLAYQHFHAAVVLSPNHALAARQLNSLRHRAQTLLQGGANNRSHLQLVLQIVPTDSDLYRKAKSRLDALP